MSRKWEEAIPYINEYLDRHPSPYLSDMVQDLAISAYVIETALSKVNKTDQVKHGLSPERKLARDKKISENIKKQYADGVFPKSSYDEEWKAKCRAGIVKFWSDEERAKEACSKRDATNRKKYGDDYRTLFQQRGNQSKLERYGDSHYNNQEQARATKLEKYGDPNYNNVEKALATCDERYGGCGNASPELLTKYEETCLERYGVKTNLLSEDPNINGINSILSRFGSMEERYKYSLAKGRETKLREHGDPFWSNQEKAKATNLERYGVENYLQLPEVRKMQRRSKASVQFCNDVLVPQYGQDDIVVEYKDKDRYPFFCDFYIKSKDLFIECNFYWTHGDHPFDPDSEADAKIVDEWRSMNNEFYYHAIYVWTDLDVRKRATALKNNLNFQSVYLGKGGKYVIF